MRDQNSWGLVYECPESGRPLPFAPGSITHDLVLSSQRLWRGVMSQGGRDRRAAEAEAYVGKGYGLVDGRLSARQARNLRNHDSSLSKIEDRGINPCAVRSTYSTIFFTSMLGFYEDGSSRQNLQSSTCILRSLSQVTRSRSDRLINTTVASEKGAEQRVSRTL